MRLAADDNVSSEPENLYSESASETSITGFNVYPVTEFMITDANFWLGVQHDNASNTIRYQESAAHVEFQQNHTYGAAPNPAPSPDSTDGVRWHLKIGHS